MQFFNLHLSIDAQDYSEVPPLTNEKEALMFAAASLLHHQGDFPSDYDRALEETREEIEFQAVNLALGLTMKDSPMVLINRMREACEKYLWLYKSDFLGTNERTLKLCAQALFMLSAKRGGELVIARGLN